MNFLEINTESRYQDPRQVAYEAPVTELQQTEDEAFPFYDQIRETPDGTTPSTYEQSARVMLVQLLTQQNWSFSRLLRRAIIALICCLWSISASLGRLTDIAIKKKELLLFSE